MKDLRRNEFVDMLNIAELLYEVSDNHIKCVIPTLGKVTYFPKADKINVHIGNEWFDDGFRRVRLVLNPKIEIDKNYIDNATSIIKRAEKSDAELRNEFAGLAMQGILSNSVYLDFISGNNGLPNPEILARLSYEIADEMVKRSKL